VEAILGAAEQLLVRQGYAASSTNAIARRAGVSIGSLYQYFGDKDDVFRALLRHHHDEMAPIARQAIEDLNGGRMAVREILARTLADSLAVRDRDPELMTALHRELAGLGEHGADHDGDQGIAALAEAFAGRLALEPDAAWERAWLVRTVLETVGRNLVHRDLDRLDRDRVCATTVEMLASMLEG